MKTRRIWWFYRCMWSSLSLLHWKRIKSLLLHLKQKRENDDKKSLAVLDIPTELTLFSTKIHFYKTGEQTIPVWKYSRVHFISQISWKNQSVNIGCISDAVNLGCMNPFKCSSLGWSGEESAKTLLVRYSTLVFGSDKTEKSLKGHLRSTKFWLRSLKVNVGLRTEVPWGSQVKVISGHERSFMRSINDAAKFNVNVRPLIST